MSIRSLKNSNIVGNSIAANKVLQVVSTTKTDTFSTTSTSFTDVTGLSASITPSSSSSKILIQVTIGNMSTDSSTQSVPAGRLVADGSAIFVGTGVGSRTASTFGQVREDNRGGSQAASGLHAPNTTSAVSYGVQVRINADTLYINRDRDDGNSAVINRPVSTITLMEIAG